MRRGRKEVMDKGEERGGRVVRGVDKSLPLSIPTFNSQPSGKHVREM